ncbi:VPLPA-CTERM sorting domain-containing protein [Gymnodinialimonas sp. 2305UL16-5]|uniref:VPLPA-CTERM sorting domain-containing protein n=1 Tax=Gymnodinialimonas mytili TaxID=3126503 RepID=UPI0030AB8B01
MKHVFLSAALLGAFVSPAAASLVINVDGAIGSGFTTWTFSGSAVARDSGRFSADDTFQSAEQFFDLGDFTDVDSFDVPDNGGAVFGNAVISVDTQLRNIDAILIDDDNTGLDDLGIGVDGNRDLAFDLGDLVAWSGVLTVEGIDIGDLDEGGLGQTFTTSFFGGNRRDALDLQLVIGGAEIAPVPLPASLPMLLAALGGAGWMARRKRV